MRILKIELQNINSLKSDFPIVIDFENEHFKDVGLYAITGSTGSGKTTILDSITIALYHSVPRFNGTKGSLVDVVSYGANEAFSRVTFENNNVKYEAYWGIRKASKTGKLLLNPQEEVRLKNLTSGTILAELKRAVFEEVIKVTQLDYNQFLRSVMLAQGEFASFLTAKGPEKGRLLEQITGEQIYKNIGQAILDRKSFEDRKLAEIRSKINSDDILSEEGRNELLQKDKALDLQIVNSEIEISSMQLIANWYEKFKELAEQSQDLENISKEINADFENHKTEFELLDLNDKAEPFSDLIQNINRNEKNSLDKINQLKTIENKIAELIPKIERFTKLSDNQLADLEKIDTEFNAWLPKFDLITKLDSELNNEIENNQRSQKKLNDVKKQIEAVKHKKEDFSKSLKDTEIKIGLNQDFISKNSFLHEVDLEISNWTRDLITLKANKENLKEDWEFVISKNKELEKTIAEIDKNNELIEKKSQEKEKIEKDLNSVTLQLSENNLSDLLAKKEELSSIESKWQQLQNLSIQAIKAEKEKDDLLFRQKTFSADLESILKQIEDIKEKILPQEALVADAEKILNLEKSIAKYENDRQNLKNGEPCGLCGSKEHPFAEHLISIGVSKSEIEFKNRNEKLKELVDSKNQLEKSEVKINTSIDTVYQRIILISEEIKSIRLTAAGLNIECNLTDTSRISHELNVLIERIKSLNESLKVAQQLQNRKDELLESLAIQNKSINSLQNTLATLNEKFKNAKGDIENKQKSVERLTKICNDLESDLKVKLSKYNYELPSIDNTNLFIQNIEELIVDFNKKQEELNVLNTDIKLINGELNNIQEQLLEYDIAEKDLAKTITDGKTKAAKIRAERNSILPLDTTVESKRNSLQSYRNQLVENHKITKNKLQVQLDDKREKEALKVKNIEEQKDIKIELDDLKITLDSQIANSDFESKQHIEKALLTREDKQNYLQNKNKIKAKQIRLETLKETNHKAFEELNNSKNFETSEDESKSTLDELKMKKDKLLAEKGEIKEAFRKDQEIKDRNKEIYEKIEKQKEVCAIWKELFVVIGNSKDAFNVYVQRLTLKRLLDLANLHLLKLNKRYSLKMEEGYKSKEELNFNLIDHYQTDQARLVDTSSGGEKFIISLALALGLSDLASKNVKIDSLFIDEGFGSLDNNTLEIVISTLETLQSQGKMIGIISHVENLKERILTQIAVSKKSDGVSIVEIL